MDTPVQICNSISRRPKSAVSTHWALASGFGPDSTASGAIKQNILSYLQREQPWAVWNSVVTMLDLLNAKAERWPLQVRVLLNQKGSTTNGLFGTTARPRYLKRRQQAMSVWANMLCFIAASWDISCRDLERMGLFLGEDMKAHIENVSIWGELGGNRKRIEEAAKDFFILAVTDPKPSPRTNPILWWLTAVIHDRLVNRLPELPMEGVEKDSVQNLDLDGKLEAFDYFAKVLILEILIHTWTPSDMCHRISWPPSCPLPTSAMKQQILTFLDHTDATLVYQDRERLGELFHKDDCLLSGPAWRECIAHLQTLIDNWLTNDARGPMREIMSLSKGVLPNRTYEDQVNAPEWWIGASPECMEERYEVMIEIWANFTDAMGAYDRGFGRAMTAGAHRLESDTDLAGANQTAREVIELEFGRKKDASLWMEHVREDGTVKVIAVFVDETHNSKVNTWVQKKVC